MYLHDIHYLTLPERALRRQPRERYITYQRDLHAISSEALDEDTLLDGDQYSYTELGDAVLAPIADMGKLKEVDLVVYAYWTPEFDPDYSAFGPYFLERYSIDGKSFDVCDNGSLASATALHVVQRYVKSDPLLRNVLVLGMEQTTIPRCRAAGIPIPARSSACAAILSSEGGSSSSHIVASGQVSELDSYGGLDPRATIETILAHAHVDASEVCLFLQRAGSFHKRLRYLIDRAREKPSFDVRFLDVTASALHTLACLARLGSPGVPTTRRYTLIVDEDVESLRMAWTLVRQAQVDTVSSGLDNAFAVGVEA